MKLNNKDEIIVVASDHETFEKYGDEIDFIVRFEAGLLFHGEQ
jgi:hypothetical protein